MRAAVLGLIGAALAVGSAGACDLTGGELKSDDGRVFRVSKLESHFDRLKSPAVNDFRRDGYVRAVIEGNGERFLIAQDYSGWGLPNNYAQSFEYTDKGAALINPRKRSQAGEQTRVDGSFQFMTGPLADVTLHPIKCK